MDLADYAEAISSDEGNIELEDGEIVDDSDSDLSIQSLDRLRPEDRSHSPVSLVTGSENSVAHPKKDKKIKRKSRKDSRLKENKTIRKHDSYYDPDEEFITLSEDDDSPTTLKVIRKTSRHRHRHKKISKIDEWEKSIFLLTSPKKRKKSTHKYSSTESLKNLGLRSSKKTCLEPPSTTSLAFNSGNSLLNKLISTGDIDPTNIVLKEKNGTKKTRTQTLQCPLSDISSDEAAVAHDLILEDLNSSRSRSHSLPGSIPAIAKQRLDLVDNDSDNDVVCLKNVMKQMPNNNLVSKKPQPHSLSSNDNIFDPDHDVLLIPQNVSQTYLSPSLKCGSAEVLELHRAKDIDEVYSPETFNPFEFNSHDPQLLDLKDIPSDGDNILAGENEDYNCIPMSCSDDEDTSSVDSKRSNVETKSELQIGHLASGGTQDSDEEEELRLRIGALKTWLQRKYAKSKSNKTKSAKPILETAEISTVSNIEDDINCEVPPLSPPPPPPDSLFHEETSSDSSFHEETPSDSLIHEETPSDSLIHEGTQSDSIFHEETPSSEVNQTVEEISKNSVKTPLSEVNQTVEEISKNSVKTPLSEVNQTVEEVSKNSVKTLLSEVNQTVEEVSKNSVKTLLSEVNQTVEEISKNSGKTLLSEVNQTVEEVSKNSVITNSSEQAAIIKDSLLKDTGNSSFLDDEASENYEAALRSLLVSNLLKKKLQNSNQLLTESNLINEQSTSLKSSERPHEKNNNSNNVNKNSKYRTRNTTTKSAQVNVPKKTVSANKSVNNCDKFQSKFVFNNAFESLNQTEDSKNSASNLKVPIVEKFIIHLSDDSDYDSDDSVVDLKSNKLPSSSKNGVAERNSTLAIKQVDGETSEKSSVKLSTKNQNLTGVKKQATVRAKDSSESSNVMDQSSSTTSFKAPKENDSSQISSSDIEIQSSRMLAPNPSAELEKEISSNDKTTALKCKVTEGEDSVSKHTPQSPKVIRSEKIELIDLSSPQKSVLPSKVTTSSPGLSFQSALNSSPSKLQQSASVSGSATAAATARKIVNVEPKKVSNPAINDVLVPMEKLLLKSRLNLLQNLDAMQICMGSCEESALKSSKMFTHIVQLQKALKLATSNYKAQFKHLKTSLKNYKDQSRKVSSCLQDYARVQKECGRSGKHIIGSNYKTPKEGMSAMATKFKLIKEKKLELLNNVALADEIKKANFCSEVSDSTVSTVLRSMNSNSTNSTLSMTVESSKAATSICSNVPSESPNCSKINTSSNTKVSVDNLQSPCKDKEISTSVCNLITDEKILSSVSATDKIDKAEEKLPVTNSKSDCVNIEPTVILGSNCSHRNEAVAEVVATELNYNESSPLKISNIVSNNPLNVPDTDVVSKSNTVENTKEVVILVREENLSNTRSLAVPSENSGKDQVLEMDQSCGVLIVTGSRSKESDEIVQSQSTFKKYMPFFQSLSASCEGEDKGSSVDSIVCPFSLQGSCRDETCEYKHLQP